MSWSQAVTISKESITATFFNIKAYIAKSDLYKIGQVQQGSLFEQTMISWSLWYYISKFRQNDSTGCIENI